MTRSKARTGAGASTTPMQMLKEKLKSATSLLRGKSKRGSDQEGAPVAELFGAAPVRIGDFCWVRAALWTCAEGSMHLSPCD